MNSHLSEVEAAEKGYAPWMWHGNNRADQLAGLAAQAHRVPQDERTRVAQQEKRAELVRRRLLRATMDAMAADPRPRREAEKLRTIPPAPIT
eukprot:8154871-Pyramimonas_sp.AAC.1